MSTLTWSFREAPVVASPAITSELAPAGFIPPMCGRQLHRVCLNISCLIKPSDLCFPETLGTGHVEQKLS